MREINLGTDTGVIHPCEIEYLKHDVLRDRYYLYFFDRVWNDYCFAEVFVADDDKIYVKDIEYRSFEGFLHALSSLVMPKMDITDLPPTIPYYIRDKRNSKNVRLGKARGRSAQLIKRVEFLEVESYANALSDEPEYLYFIVNNMRAYLQSFEYHATFSCRSKVPLRKYIIARHKTAEVLEDLPHNGHDFLLSFQDEEVLNIRPQVEKDLVLKIMQLESSRRKNMNPILLTKIVRMMLARKDYLEAAREYQNYLSDYYDKWVKEGKYKHI